MNESLENCREEIENYKYIILISLCIGVASILFGLWCANVLPNQMINRCNNKAVEMGHAYWAPSTNGSPVFTWNIPCGE